MLAQSVKFSDEPLDLARGLLYFAEDVLSVARVGFVRDNIKAPFFRLRFGLQGLVVDAIAPERRVSILNTDTDSPRQRVIDLLASRAR